jgi:hypothetical protein
MSRERAATCPLAGDQFALLVVHRIVAERSMVDLLTSSARVGDPVRAGMFHLARCSRCTAAALTADGALCRRGRRLLEPCHGWRERGAA